MKIKRTVFALLMTIVMALSCAAPVSAQAVDTPSASQSDTVSVSRSDAASVSDAPAVDGQTHEIGGLMLKIVLLFVLIYLTAVFMNKRYERKNGGADAPADDTSSADTSADGDGDQTE